MGVGMMALPMLFSAGAALMGGGGGAQAAGVPGGTPWDGAFKPQPAPPPMPEKNENFHGPGDPAKAIPEPFSGGLNIPPRPMTEGDKTAPGADVLKSTPSLFGPQPAPQSAGQPAKMLAQPTDTVQATDVTGQPMPKAAPKAAAAIPSTPQGGLFGGGDTPEDTAPEAAPPARRKSVSPTAPVQAATMDTTPAEDDEGDGQFEPGNGLVRGLFGNKAGDFMGTLNDKLGDTATNPLFQVGMGLLSSGYDGSNPYAAIQKSLSAVPGHQIAAQTADLAVNADRRAASKDAREADAQTREQQLAALLASIGLKYNTPENQGGSSIARGGAKVIK